MVKKSAKKISNTVKGVTNSAINKIKEYTLYITIAVLAILGIILIGHPASSIVSSLVEMSDLRKRKALYEESIRRDSLLIENLKNDEFLERYAREKYFMKGQNEDLFIVE
ncbi:MAG: hypothetical protein IKA07_02550 [Alistipes sp.]|nr:hypothetical protein [Alistipes sp.]